MNNKKSLALGMILGIIGLIAVAGVITVASAHPFSEGENDGKNFRKVMMNGEGMEGMAEMHEQVEVALENGDYEAWKAIHEEYGMTRMSEYVTEENFQVMVQMHEAMKNGDYEKMKELREEESGIQGRGFGMMRAGGCPMHN